VNASARLRNAWQLYNAILRCWDAQTEVSEFEYTSLRSMLQDLNSAIVPGANPEMTGIRQPTSRLRRAFNLDHHRTKSDPDAPPAHMETLEHTALRRY
jgi:hypothetical protein